MGIWNRLIGRPDRDDFARMMIKILRKGGETRPLDYDATEFLLRVGSSENRVYLGNFYADYMAAARRDRKVLLAKLAGLTQPAPEMDLAFAEAKKMLLPRVRERFYHEVVRLDAIFHGAREEEFKPMPTRLLNEHLTVEVVIDMPDRVGIVSESQLKEWGISLDEALALGRENLWRLSTKSFESLGPGLYASSVSDTHDASRMYLHDLVWQHEVKGRHVVIAPNRNLLLVSGSEEAEALAKMVAVAEEVLQQPRAMTGMAFELDGSTWKPWLPPVESPLYQQFHNLALRSMARDYGEQKNLLEKIFQKQAKDIFVGSPLYVQRKKDGSIYSTSSWAQDVDTLLAQADYVSFAEFPSGAKPQIMGYGRWERVVEVAGGLMHRTEHYPPRYHVTQFPTKDQLAAMDLVDVPP